MKKLTLPLAAVALVGLYGTAHAQCDFNLAPAKGMKASMVRTYESCPGTEHPVPNASTEGGTTACTPVIPAAVDGVSTPYAYGPKGKCTVTTKAKLLKDCSAAEDAEGNSLGLGTNACHITYVTSKCSDIHKTDIGLPIDEDDAGFSLATLTRATFNDAANGDMTVIDFPVSFQFSIPEEGSMELESSSAQELIPLVGAGNADLPACTSLEIVDTTIKDPDNLPFAKLGTATKPKE